MGQGMQAARTLRRVGPSAQPMFGVALDGTVVLWNQAIERLFGIPAARALGRPCHELIAGADPLGQPLCSGDCFVLAEAQTGRGVACYDLLAHDAGGRPLRISVNVVVLHDEEGRPAAVLHLLRSDAPGEASFEPPGLTAREREILSLLIQGLSTRQIAERLVISHATARNHVQHILAKLGVHSRGQAVARLRAQPVVDRRPPGASEAPAG